MPDPGMGLIYSHGEAHRGLRAECHVMMKGRVCSRARAVIPVDFHGVEPCLLICRVVFLAAPVAIDRSILAHVAEHGAEVARHANIQGRGHVMLILYILIIKELGLSIALQLPTDLEVHRDLSLLKCPR